MTTHSGLSVSRCATCMRQVQRRDQCIVIYEGHGDSNPRGELRLFYQQKRQSRLNSRSSYPVNHARAYGGETVHSLP